MRLLNVHTFRLEEFLNDPPSYTILSHTWEDEEVSLQQLESGSGPSLKGYQKIWNCCVRSAGEGYDYTWIDTCCIDKTSSVELSEAINSMYQWYSHAGICYAFLGDVVDKEVDDTADVLSAFSKSRWFSRGWTLQELLAPRNVLFLNRHWDEIGSKRTLAETISQITKIHRQALEVGVCTRKRKHGCAGFSVAQKMSWAAHRQTTRKEDMAYSLMGLFDVHMPLLYGEGGWKAFQRLLSEIMKESNDDSVFAFQPDVFGRPPGILARSPKEFAGCSVVCGPTRRAALGGPAQDDRVGYEVNKDDITISVPLLGAGSKSEPPVYIFEADRDVALKELRNPWERKQCVAVLRSSIASGRLGIVLTEYTEAGGVFYQQSMRPFAMVVLKWEHCSDLGPLRKIRLSERQTENRYSQACNTFPAILSRPNTCLSITFWDFRCQLENRVVCHRDGTSMVSGMDKPLTLDSYFIDGSWYNEFVSLEWQGEPSGQLWEQRRGVCIKLDFQHQRNGRHEDILVPAFSILCNWTAGTWKFDVGCSLISRDRDQGAYLPLQNLSTTSRYSKFLLGDGAGHVFAHPEYDVEGSLACVLRYQKPAPRLALGVSLAAQEVVKEIGED